MRSIGNKKFNLEQHRNFSDIHILLSSSKSRHWYTLVLSHESLLMTAASLKINTARKVIQDT